MHGAAARLAATVRQAMKDQALSSREVASRIERLTGKPFPEQYVGRRLNQTSVRPMIGIADDLRYMVQVLGLDLSAVISDAVGAEDRCPTCGSPDRAVRWNVRWNLDLDPDADLVPCKREFHDNAACAKLLDGVRCGQPIEYVSEGGDAVSGWYHTDRSLTASHHAISPDLAR